MADDAERLTEPSAPRPFKQPTTGGGGRSGSTDVPSWVKELDDGRPHVGESGKEFARRLLDRRYGSGNYPTGATTEFDKIKKYGDRHFG